MKNIQLIAPASYVPNLTKNELSTLKKQLEQIDIKVNYTDNLFKEKFFWAGEDKIRLNELENAFLNDDTDAILALRGGEGSMRLLDKIDYHKLKKNNKPLFGFSDITALQNALWKKAKIQSFTGFLGCYGTKKITPTLFKNLKLALNNKIEQIPTKTIKSGKADGILLGGNLTTFTALLGTPYMPKMNNNILLLEETSTFLEIKLGFTSSLLITVLPIIGFEASPLDNLESFFSSLGEIKIGFFFSTNNCLVLFSISFFLSSSKAFCLLAISSFLFISSNLSLSLLSSSFFFFSNNNFS